MIMEKIDINESTINFFASGYGGDCVLRCLSLSWQDAKNYKSVTQNAGQRMSLIEDAITLYITKLTGAEVEKIKAKLESLNNAHQQGDK